MDLKVIEKRLRLHQAFPWPPLSLSPYTNSLYLFTIIYAAQTMDDDLARMEMEKLMRESERRIMERLATSLEASESRILAAIGSAGTSPAAPGKSPAAGYVPTLSPKQSAPAVAPHATAPAPTESKPAPVVRRAAQPNGGSAPLPPGRAARGAPGVVATTGPVDRLAELRVIFLELISQRLCLVVLLAGHLYGDPVWNGAHKVHDEEADQDGGVLDPEEKDHHDPALAFNNGGVVFANSNP